MFVVALLQVILNSSSFAQWAKPMLYFSMAQKARNESQQQKKLQNKPICSLYIILKISPLDQKNPIPKHQGVENSRKRDYMVLVM